MKILPLWRLILAGWVALSMGASAQKAITWQNADASGAGSVADATHFLYTSAGQSATGVSSGPTRILHSGYLHIRLVPSGAANIVAQSSVDFGNVIVGQSVLRTLTVQNTGAVPLNITSTTIAPAAYAINGGGGAQSIPAGGSVSMQLQFLPSAAGTINGTLTINSNAANDPSMTIALSGVGVASAPDIQLSATALDFGAVTVGSNSVRSVTVGNTGNAVLTLSSQSVSGSDMGSFSITHNAAGSINPGANDFVEIRFTALSAGAKTATLNIACNDPNEPVCTITLHGSGITSEQARLTLSTTLLDFGTTPPSTPVERTVVLTNSGTANLVLTGQTVNGNGFTLLSPAATPIPPGGNASARVQFNPSSNGSYNGTLTIASNDPMQPSASVTLRGSCAAVSGPRVAFSRTLVDFGTVQVLTPKDEDILVRNIGTGDLVITSQSIGGADAVHFSIAQPASTPIPSGGSSTLRVRHLPISEGSKSALLQLGTNDAGMPVAEVALLSRAVLDIERLPGVPERIILYQNFPNPFNPSTTIVYDLDREAEVALEVYDSYSRLVQRLIGQWQERGVYQATFTAPATASGMLTAVLLVRSAGNTVARRISMMLVK